MIGFPLTDLTNLAVSVVQKFDELVSDVVRMAHLRLKLGERHTSSSSVDISSEFDR